jgi:hypothetical protein
VSRVDADIEETVPAWRVRLLLAKYAGRSKWVGYETPRREAWDEIERDLRSILPAPDPRAPEDGGRG